MLLHFQIFVWNENVYPHENVELAENEQLATPQPFTCHQRKCLAVKASSWAQSRVRPFHDLNPWDEGAILSRLFFITSLFREG